MRNTRLPVSLNEATWTMTDTASSTNRPPTIASSSSCLVRTAIAPSAPPERERAGVAHEHLRRWRVEPQEAERRRRPSRRRTPPARRRRADRDLQVLAKIDVADQVARCSAKQPAAIIAGPIARPSRPSVRLTAFEAPTMTSTPNGTNSQPSVQQQVLKNGTARPVGAAARRVSQARRCTREQRLHGTGRASLERPRARAATRLATLR